MSLVYQVPSVLLISNLYLVNRLLINVYFMTQPYVGQLFRCEHLKCVARVAWNPTNVRSPIIICYKRF